MTRRHAHEPAPRPYRIAVAIIRFIVRLLRWRVDAAGMEQVPPRGPVLLVANHVSYLDPILLGIPLDAAGRTVRYLAKREMFDHWFTGPVVRGADQILVDRKGDAGAALRHAEAALANGKMLVIYPEGTIHPVFDAANAKTGAARLALATGVPVLPAVAWGGQQIGTKTGGVRVGAGTAHLVRVGPPIPYDPDDTVEDLTARIMAAIAVLLTEVAADHPRDLGPAVAVR